jgi:hypothetical protein
VRFDNTRIFKVKDESQGPVGGAIFRCDINDAEAAISLVGFPKSRGKRSFLGPVTAFSPFALPHFYAQ